MKNNIPIYRVNVENPECTITTISLVDEPAMEVQMMCFKRDEFKFQKDEMKHNILTCLVRVDYPIIRLTEDNEPFYVVFDKKAAETLCKKLMTDGYQQNISTNHDGKLIEGVTLQEVFIKDSTKGIAPEGFDECPDGSLFCIYHIDNEDIWNDCLEGKFKGVSLESYLSLEKFKKTKTKSNMAKLKEKIKMLLMEFNNLSTDRAEIYWEEDTELNVGYKVFVENENGDKIAAPDGEYLSDENKIKVENGEVTEIEKKDAETGSTEENMGCEKKSKFASECKAKFESYEETERRIAETIAAEGVKDFYITEAGEGYAVISVWEDDTNKYLRYDVAIDGDNITVSNPTEVVYRFVPVNEPKAEEFAAEEQPKGEEQPIETAETAETEENKVEETDTELVKRIEAIEAKLEEVVTKLAEIAQTPAAEPVIEEFDKAVRSETPKTKFDRQLALAKALREV